MTDFHMRTHPHLSEQERKFLDDALVSLLQLSISATHVIASIHDCPDSALLLAREAQVHFITAVANLESYALLRTPVSGSG
jgi:hypothetical protein